MKLSQFKTQLENLEKLDFYLENGTKIPSHFHITEIGITTKHFTDCGNTFRISKKATFQLWSSTDIDHRLNPKKVIAIIDSTSHLFDEDLDIEIEFQQETVGKFALNFENDKFVLTNTFTDCLAKESCGFPIEKIKKSINELVSNCTPNSGCC